MSGGGRWWQLRSVLGVGVGGLTALISTITLDTAIDTGTVTGSAVTLIISALGGPFFMSLGSNTRGRTSGLNCGLIILSSRGGPTGRLTGIRSLAIHNAGVLLVGPASSSTMNGTIGVTGRTGVPIVALSHRTAGNRIIDRVTSSGMLNNGVTNSCVTGGTNRNTGIVRLRNVTNASTTHRHNRNFRRTITTRGFGILTDRPTSFSHAGNLGMVRGLLATRPSIRTMFTRGSRVTLNTLHTLRATNGSSIVIIKFSNAPSNRGTIGSNGLTTAVTRLPSRVNTGNIRATSGILGNRGIRTGCPISLGLIIGR